MAGAGSARLPSPGAQIAPERCEEQVQVQGLILRAGGVRVGRQPLLYPVTCWEGTRLPRAPWLQATLSAFLNVHFHA